MENIEEEDVVAERNVLDSTPVRFCEINHYPSLHMPSKFLLYARKSTDVEDKQVLSIEAQLDELRLYAKEHDIEIAEEFVEKQSAKFPGRPIFNTMLERIEKGEASGILSWHPDRLARNSVDGGRIVYLLDLGKLQGLKFPSFWFESTPQGKFMLNMAFVQSKYYVDALSENTKRGLRQKVRRGEFPGTAPVGYLNDVRMKCIVIDRKRSVIVRKAFELYAENKSKLEDIADFLADHGIVSSGGNKRSRDQISFLLTNPFYYGYFKYDGELHEGRHPAIITKQLFDRVQEVLKERSHPGHTVNTEARALCGLFHCGTCQMMITGERKVKRQKSGKVHTYTYYHCTKKSKAVECGEPCILEKALDQQLSALLEQHFMPSDWAKELLMKIELDVKEGAESQKLLADQTRDEIRDLKLKLERLLDSYLEQDIEREVYLEKKAHLMSQRKSLEEKVSRLSRDRIAWIEPMKKWIERAQNMENIAQDQNLFEKKVAAKEIFGSNLSLTQKNVVVLDPENVVNVVGKNVVGGLRSHSENVVDLSETIGQNVVETNQETSPYSFENVVGGCLKRQWAALYAARQVASEKPTCIVLAPGLGFEPRYTASKAVVLPLDDPGINELWCYHTDE